MSHHRAGRTYFVDEAGRQWRRGQCPDCRNAYARKNNEDRGVHKPRGKSNAKNILRGWESETVVSKLLGSLGVPHTRSLAQGPDITTVAGITIEVKTVSDKGVVSPVCKNRKFDNYVALVCGDSVLFQPMNSHLALCAKSGYRYLKRSLTNEDSFCRSSGNETL